MFEKASRLNLRFDTSKGNLAVEDMWTLNTRVFDETFKSLNKELKGSEEESLFSEGSNTVSNKELTLKVEILRHIAGIRKEEADTRKNAASKLEEKKKLIAVLAQKEDAELLDKTPEQLREMIASM